MTQLKQNNNGKTNNTCFVVMLKKKIHQYLASVNFTQITTTHITHLRPLGPASMSSLEMTEDNNT